MDDSDDLHMSDLQTSVLTIKHTKDLVGYRNLLSYTTSLDLRVLPKSSTDPKLWTYIGSGSYSITWKATFAGAIEKVVAVKQPLVSFTRAKVEVENQVQHEALSSIIQELRILSHPKLKCHPNLPNILGVFFQEEENPPGIRPCLLFDLAVSDLEKYLQRMRSQGIPGREMISLCSNVADGICALHSSGLVHGDIKPDNIFLFHRDGKLTATIGDFGSCGVSAQTSGVINGTTWYSAPEYDRESPYRKHVNQPFRDVYTFGLVVWSVLTYCKERPFPREAQYNLQHDDKMALQSLFNRIPTVPTVPELREVIHLCVKTRPESRASIFDICRRLDTALDNHR